MNKIINTRRSTTMKRLKIAGLCLVSMLAMGMALAGNASAALLWLVCLEGSGLTKYSSNQCTEASGTGKWQSLGLPSGSSDTVRLLAFSLRLADNGTGAEIECPDPGTTGWGLIESPSKGIIKEAKISEPKVNCKLLKPAILGCRETNNIEAIEGVNLPQESEIFTTEGKILGRGKVGVSAPGWKIRCGGITDECIEATGNPEFAELNNEVTKGVLLIRARAEERAKQHCSVLGGNTGEVKGLAAILLWNGNGLSISSV
jgi:hypothetical protein